MKNSFFQLPIALLQAVNSASFNFAQFYKTWKAKGRAWAPWFDFLPAADTAFTEGQQHSGLITALQNSSEQLSPIRCITNLQEAVGVHLVAGGVHDARGQPDALGGTGQALRTQGRTPEQGLGLGTALHLSLCGQHHVCGSSGACKCLTATTTGTAQFNSVSQANHEFLYVSNYVLSFSVSFYPANWCCKITIFFHYQRETKKAMWGGGKRDKRQLIQEVTTSLWAAGVGNLQRLCNLQHGKLQSLYRAGRVAEGNKDYCCETFYMAGPRGNWNTSCLSKTCTVSWCLWQNGLTLTWTEQKLI